MDVLARLEQTRDSLSVLRHPFYLRWSAGELSAAELGCYAGEYRHAVGALARASKLAGEKAPPAHRAGLRRHAAEEASHVALWEQFAQAAGAPAPGRADQALPETRACVESWVAGEDLLDHLAVLYVIEGAQPEVSRTKLDGLTEHYGYDDEGPASEYFRVHELLDSEHARQGGELIEELIGGAGDPAGQAERMLGCAEAALRGNWSLLDGVAHARGVSGRAESRQA